MSVFKFNQNRVIKLVFPTVLLSSTLIAAIMAASAFKQVISTLSGGGGKSSSPGFTMTASMATGTAGDAESASYTSESGFGSQITVATEDPPAVDLSETFIYPSPYKPGTGGKFDADFLTFKSLTAEATIRVFNIAGELITTIEKTDTAVDYHEWDATNDAGETIASGVYIYYITDPDGNTTSGKFAVIR
ncbi:T9SS type A sorting domain-containing protein [Elusimicrobiota bacterium]